MKSRIILIFALFLTLTSFRSDEKAVKEGDVKIFRSASAQFQPPRFVQELRDITVQEGQTAVFEARLADTDVTYRITWYKNGREIVPDKRIRTVYDWTYVSLIIKDVRQEDAGVYSVKAVNVAGEAVSSAKLRVEVRL